MASIFMISWDIDDLERNHMDFNDLGVAYYLNEQPPNNFITHAEAVHSRRVGRAHVEMGGPLYLRVCLCPSRHHYDNQGTSADERLMRVGALCSTVFDENLESCTADLPWAQGVPPASIGGCARRQANSEVNLTHPI